MGEVSEELHRKGTCHILKLQQCLQLWILISDWPNSPAYTVLSQLNGIYNRQ